MTEEISPPDGGPRALIVVAASFMCNGLIFGFINTYSVLNVEILAIFQKNGVDNALAKAGMCLSFMCLLRKTFVQLFLLFSLDRLFDPRNDIFPLHDIRNRERSHRNSNDYIYRRSYSQL